MGPFKFSGVLMDESPQCWTNHQSIIEFKNQWYLFYHHNDLSPALIRTGVQESTAYFLMPMEPLKR